MIKALAIYLVGINMLATVVYGIDKWKARHDIWRTPEPVLLLLALAGGSIGALLGMKLFHHKTAKPKFKCGIPAILIAQLLIIGILISKNNFVNFPN